MIQFGGFMDKKILTFLSKTFLFKDIPLSSLEKMLEKTELEILSYTKNECIYAQNAFMQKLGFVYDGECLVERIKSSGAPVPLNSLKKHDSFGITAVLSIDNDIPTTVVAKKATSVLFISKNEVLELMRAHSGISFNVISFLANRVAFLNKKLEMFTSDNTESRLASFLLQKHKSEKSDEISVNLSSLADMLSCGRASVYRAIESLTSDGAIKYNNKKFYILDASRLERNAK